MRLRDFFYEFFAILPNLFSVFLGIKKRNKNPTKEIPIILLHGIFCSNVSLWKLKKRLETLGYVVYVPWLGRYFISIEKIAQKFNDYLNKESITRYILISHSIGGIVGLYHYLIYKPDIVKAIMIGAPFHGAHLYYTHLISKTASQINMNSTFLTELRKKKLKHKHFYSIGSESDELVSISSTKLEGTKSIIVKKEGHVEMLLSQKVFQTINDILKK